MQGDHNPNSQRFQVYNELPNGKGFKIKNSKYIYMFDKFGGWYDQYNNYYNKVGQTEDPPSDEEQEFERVVLEDEQGDDFDDDFEKEYGGNINDNQDYEDEETHHISSQQQKILESIAHNQAILHDYPLKTPLRVDFENMKFTATKEQILKHYRSKVSKGILNVIQTKEEGKFIGQGYFVCDNVSTAQKLIKLQAEQFLTRKVHFNIEKVEQFLVDPVSKKQMNITININQDDFESLVKQQPKIEQAKQQAKGNKKKYTTKQKNTELKTQVKQEKKAVQLKKEQIVPLEKPVQKKQPEQPSWSKYKGDVTMFPKKASFKQWMNKLGFNENEHFKNPQKCESPSQGKKWATVELRSDVYKGIEGQLYQNQKVHFQKVN